jgi:GH25 family lysozyme M1 (1,4-beta-N-acetylmuramidase)
VDVYQGDLNGHPNWRHLVDLGAPWHGAIIKATEGQHYSPDWFSLNWRTLSTVAGDRRGVDWFRGAYHFLRFSEPGEAQADYYLNAVETSGGWSPGDLWPIVDVELGEERSSNRLASAQQIVDVTSAFAERVKERTGRDTMLYGNGAMAERGIRSKMGCKWLWCPRYTPTLPRKVYEQSGWRVEDLVLWQYSGDGEAKLAGYPASPPGFGKCDVSVLVKPLEWLRKELP